jgi:hypothetical protein
MQEKRSELQPANAESAGPAPAASLGQRAGSDNQPIFLERVWT